MAKLVMQGESTGHSSRGDRPSLKQLYDHVVRKAAVKWREVGVQLFNESIQDDLDIIEANHKDDVVRCFQEMFSNWLKKQENTSWDQLLKALQSPSVHLMDLANQIEAKILDGDDNAVYGETVSSHSEFNKLRTTEDLEVEFVIATKKIKQALCNSHIDVTPVIEQLQAISAVRNKNVPLLDEDVFENVTTVEKLWQRLSRFWSIYNYDMLRILLRIVECKRADEILEEFLSRIDVSTIEDMEIVAHYEVFKWQGWIKPLLRIKIKAERCTNSVRKKVEETLSSILNLKEYTLTFRGIKEGCIELIYEISNAVMLYFLQCKFTGYDLAEFAAHDIISIHINDMELIIPSEIDMDRKYEWFQTVQTDQSDATKNGNRKIGSAILDIVGFALLCNFIIKISFALTLDSQFIDKNIIIVPAIIGLMSLSNFYFVRGTALAVVEVVSPVVKKATLTITTDINPVVKGIYLAIAYPFVKRTALIVVTAISLIVKSQKLKKMCSTIVTAINYVVRKPYIIVAVSNTLEHIFNFHLTDNMSIALHFFVFIILTINHLHFNRSTIRVTLFFTICLIIFGWYINFHKILRDTTKSALFVIVLLLCFSILSDLHSYKSLLWLVVVLSITIFICDSVSSFVETAYHISELLRDFCKFLMLFVVFDTMWTSYHEGFKTVYVAILASCFLYRYGYVCIQFLSLIAFKMNIY